MNIELSAVEYDHGQQAYIGILSNGEFFLLEADNLRTAELEAQRYVDQMNEAPSGEYSNFRGVASWK